MDDLIVVVGSKNRVKLDAVREGFSAVFHRDIEIVGVSVSSGVGEQPRDDAEMFQGALNRASNARAAQAAGHYWVGIESGVEELFGSMQDYGYVVVVNSDGIGFARTVSFPISSGMSDLLAAGMDLQQVMESRFGIVNAGSNLGAIGHLTRGAIPRKQQIVPAVITALVPFLHPEEFFSGT